MERGDNQMVMRIVATLLALATVALRASCASWPVRCIVLVLLRRGEAVARVYALNAGVPALAPVRIRRHGANGIAELASLSRRFRVLALTLLVAAARLSRASLPPDRGWPASPIAGMLVFAMKGAEVRSERAPMCPDTS